MCLWEGEHIRTGFLEVYCYITFLCPWFQHVNSLHILYWTVGVCFLVHLSTTSSAYSASFTPARVTILMVVVIMVVVIMVVVIVVLVRWWWWEIPNGHGNSEQIICQSFKLLMIVDYYGCYFCQYVFIITDYYGWYFQPICFYYFNQCLIALVVSLFSNVPFCQMFLCYLWNKCADSF